MDLGLDDLLLGVTAGAYLPLVAIAVGKRLVRTAMDVWRAPRTSAVKAD